MANIARLNRLIDFMATHDSVGFSYTTYYDPDFDPKRDMSGRHCGTVACVAGWTVLLMMEENFIEKKMSLGYINEHAQKYAGYNDSASDYLELTTDERNELFFADDDGIDDWRRTVTLRQAINTIKRFADTGVIDYFS